jgi:hypothetical protein
MQTDKKILFALAGLILCCIIGFGFYSPGLLSGPSGMKDFPAQTGMSQPSVVTPKDNVTLTINPIPEYPAGETFAINGTTTLPVGEVLDIALIKEPFHTTKCDPGKFCGAGTYSTTVSSGLGNNTWSLDLNTSGFTEGGYDIWVLARYNPNTSIHAGLLLKKS